MISMLRLSAPATGARLGNLETVGNLVEAASEEGRVLETLMNPQFGLKQAMLSPGGKSPAHSEHAMLHTELHKHRHRECWNVMGGFKQYVTFTSNRV